VLHELAHLLHAPFFFPDFVSKQYGIWNDDLLSFRCRTLIEGLQ
jgi:hypothetical protein